MAAPFATRVNAVLAKVETVSGTDATPTLSANALRTVGAVLLNFGYLAGNNRDDVVWGGLGAIERAAPTGRFGKFDVTLEVKGYGAAYSATNRPEGDAFLRASGMSATVVTTAGSESVTYTTLDTALETMTVYLYAGSKLFKLVGCTASPKLSAAANGRGLITFSVQGRLVSDPTDQSLGATTVNLTTPPVFAGAGAGLSIGSFTPASSEPLMLRQLDVDWGTVTTERSSAGASDGLVGWVITDRKIRWTETVEAVSLSTFDPYALSKTVLSGLPLVAAAIGTVQYNRMKLFGGKWALEAPTVQDASGLLTWQLQGNLVAGTESTSGRELRLVFD